MRRTRLEAGDIDRVAVGILDVKNRDDTRNRPDFPFSLHVRLLLRPHELKLSVNLLKIGHETGGEFF
jgi:hypothetical protein